jgi:hypothetical protein
MGAWPGDDASVDTAEHRPIASSVDSVAGEEPEMSDPDQLDDADDPVDEVEAFELAYGAFVVTFTRWTRPSRASGTG